MDKPINLDKSCPGHAAKKFNCPSCGKKRFVRFWNSKTEEYLAEQYGRCDREEGCGYFQSPFDDMKKNKTEKANSNSTVKMDAPTNFVKPEQVKLTLDHYERNNFFIYIRSLIGEEAAIRLFIKFFIGTAKNNGTIFWQVDSDMRIRTGQKIHYNLDGKRIKQGKFSGATRLFKVEDGYSPCLFGLHQLRTATPNSVVAIVESEKSAVIASIFMPELQNGTPIIWMASSGSNGLTDEKIFYLRNRTVILCPDYSYSARATWGLLPMHKKPKEFSVNGGTITRLVPDPEGDFQKDFIPTKARFTQIGCTVKFLDHHPELNNSEDIADHFLKIHGSDELRLPDFNELTLRMGNDSQKEKESLTEPYFEPAPEPEIRGLDDFSQFHLPVENLGSSKVLENQTPTLPSLPIGVRQGFASLTTRDGKYFEIGSGPENELQFTRTDHPPLVVNDQQKVDVILANPLIQKLISKFDLEIRG